MKRDKFSKLMTSEVMHVMPVTEDPTITISLARYTELIRAEAERDIIARACEAEASYNVSSIVKAVATIREDAAKAKVPEQPEKSETPETPKGADTEGGDA